MAIVLGLVSLSRRLGDRWAWCVAPWLLSFGALLPTLVRRRDLRELGFQWGRAAQGTRSLCWGSAALLAAGVGMIFLYRRMETRPPLAGAVPPPQTILWILAQFGYVALPEELFFRGYLLINTLDFLRLSRKSGRAAERAGVVVSAGVFALAHLLSLGRVDAALTFFPGLIFGWLFVTTRSLLAPVLLHGVANVGYALLLSKFA